MYNRKTMLLALTALGLAGCNDFDGEYLPGCAAYTGDRITLDGARFTWDRFTDVVRVDDYGNRIDPFPGYPVSGTVSVDDNRVRFVADTGNEIAVRRVVIREGDVALLTQDDYEAWQSSGRWPDCPLVRGEPELQ